MMTLLCIGVFCFLLFLGWLFGRIRYNRARAWGQWVGPNDGVPYRDWRRL